MALSERERRVLDEIERELSIEDPKLLRSTRLRGSRLRSLIAGSGSATAALLTVVFGTGLVAVGLTAPGNVAATVLAVVGFALVVAACWLGFTGFRRRLRGGRGNRP